MADADESLLKVWGDCVGTERYVETGNDKTRFRKMVDLTIGRNGWALRISSTAFNSACEW